MASTRTIQAVMDAYWKAHAKWEDAFNGINHALAYSVHSSEDNPKGNLDRLDAKEYMDAFKAIRDLNGKLAQELFTLKRILEKAKPGKIDCSSFHHSGTC